jgi:hypothetical protein
MSRTLALLPILILSLALIALVACGGGDEEEEGTQAPTTPTSATATQAAAVTPTAPSFSGGATANVKVGDQTFTFEDGKCDIAPDETWLAVNIGQPGGEYFGLLVGSNEAAPAGARPISGGGVFTDGEVALTIEQGGSSFLMGGIGAAAEANKVTLPADLSSGEFEGTTLDGQPISGSFQC